jgi:hypothetical protein
VRSLTALTILIAIGVACIVVAVVLFLLPRLRRDATNDRHYCT